MKSLATTTKVSYEDWKELRKKGIGGSDIGSIFGFNQYKSAIQLWLEKTGQVEAPDLSDKLSVKLGNKLEDIVAELFEEETGLKVRRNNHILLHPEHDFILANIDREGKDEEGKRFILECKTASSYAGKQWKDDEIPLAYEMQVLHYLTVTGYDYGYIACLVGNHQFVIKKIEINDLIKNHIIEKCKWFWDLVQTKTMPPVDNSEACSNILSELYPEAIADTSIVISPTLDEELNKLSDLDSQVKDLESKITLIKNRVKEFMQDNELAVSDNHKITWKNQLTNRFDTKTFKTAYPDLYAQFTKESQSRVLRIK